MPLLTLIAVLGAAAQPAELGKVRWLRDFDAAVKRSRETKKPLLVLFDEIPGCDTVLSFGREVLSDARVVEDRKLECANRVFTAKEAANTRFSEKHTKYFLRSSRGSVEGLSEQEQVRLNSAR